MPSAKEQAELQKLNPKSITKQNSLTRVLRPRANDVNLARKIRRCKRERRDYDIDKARTLKSHKLAKNKQTENLATVQDHFAKKSYLNKFLKRDEGEILIDQSHLEDTKPGIHFTIRFKRWKGRATYLSLSTSKGREALGLRTLDT